MPGVVASIPAPTPAPDAQPPKRGVSGKRSGIAGRGAPITRIWGSVAAVFGPLLHQSLAMTARCTAPSPFRASMRSSATRA